MTEVLHQDQSLALYESLADVTGQMLVAAQKGDWDNLFDLETGCASQLNSLKILENETLPEHAEKTERVTNLTEDMRLRKRSLIEKILADDREIRILTETRMAYLSKLLNRGRVERQLSTAYGSHQVF